MLLLLYGCFFLFINGFWGTKNNFFVLNLNLRTNVQMYEKLLIEKRMSKFLLLSYCCIDIIKIVDKNLFSFCFQQLVNNLCKQLHFLQFPVKYLYHFTLYCLPKFYCSIFESYKYKLNIIRTLIFIP